MGISGGDATLLDAAVETLRLRKPSGQLSRKFGFLYRWRRWAIIASVRPFVAAAHCGLACCLLPQRRLS